MKRLWSALVVVTLLACFVPLASARGPVVRDPVPPRLGAALTSDSTAGQAPAAIPATTHAQPAVEPPQVDAAVNLTLDDGAAENYIGLNSTEHGVQFLWLNRFTPAPDDFPFQLDKISVVFGSSGVTLGGALDLVVYQDTDGGDPSNATVVAVYHETVLANDGTTWSEYPLTPPLTLDGPGDVLIGAINRYTPSGVGPPTYPAALDATTSQVRSWAASWSGDPPDPPVLPPDGLWGTIDSYGFPGNWLIRGSGRNSKDVSLPLIFKGFP